MNHPLGNIVTGRLLAKVEADELLKKRITAEACLISCKTPMAIQIRELHKYLQNEFKKQAAWPHNPVVREDSDFQAFADDMKSTAFQTVDDIRQAVNQVDQERIQAAKQIAPLSLIGELTYAIAILDVNFQKKRYPAHSEFFAQFRQP